MIIRGHTCFKYGIEFRISCLLQVRPKLSDKTIIIRQITAISFYLLRFCWDTCHSLHLFWIGSFNPLDSYIWFELYGSPSDRDVNILGSVCLLFSSLFSLSISSRFVALLVWQHKFYLVLLLAGYPGMVCHGPFRCI